MILQVIPSKLLMWNLNSVMSALLKRIYFWFLSTQEKLRRRLEIPVWNLRLINLNVTNLRVGKLVQVNLNIDTFSHEIWDDELRFCSDNCMLTMVNYNSWNTDWDIWEQIIFWERCSWYGHLSLHSIRWNSTLMNEVCFTWLWRCTSITS